MDDNVEMTDRSIQGGFSAVGLPRAINRRGGPKEGEEKKEGVAGNERGGRARGATMRKDKLGSVVFVGPYWAALGCRRENAVRTSTFKKTEIITGF